MIKGYRSLSFALGFFVLFMGHANGGVFTSAGLGWRSYSLKPLAEESTPNLNGETPYLGVGYSLAKVFDVNAFSRYTPAVHSVTKVGYEDASIIFGGLQMAIRLGSSVYLGVSGGLLRYHLLANLKENDLPGLWSGPGGEFIVGALTKTGKHTFWQITFDVGLAELQPQKSNSAVSSPDLKRVMNWVGLTINYVFIGLDALRIDSVFMQEWLQF